MIHPAFHSASELSIFFSSFVLQTPAFHLPRAHPLKKRRREVKLSKCSNRFCHKFEMGIKRQVKRVVPVSMLFVAETSFNGEFFYSR